MSGVKGRVQEKVSSPERRMTLADQINKMIPQIARVLPEHMSADKMARIALNEIKKNPSLGQCDPASFFGALLNASQLGLEPGPLGHAYLIPYRGQVTLQLGYRGLLELVTRSDKVDSVFAYEVYEGDVFNYHLGIKPDIQHTPASTEEIARLKAEKRLKNDGQREITHVYAVAHIKNMDIPRVEVMTRDEIDAIRKRSQAGNSGPWVTDYAQMARKTVLKRLCKTLPLSAEVHGVISKDESVRTINRETITIDNSTHMLEVETKEDGPHDDPPGSEGPEAAEPADEEKKKAAKKSEKPAPRKQNKEQDVDTNDEDLDLPFK
jgi:recombination protein RecT